MVKAAREATWHGADVVVKVPKSNDVETTGTFRRILEHELFWRRLLPHQYVYKVYGSCTDAGYGKSGQVVPFQVTEAGLVQFSWAQGADLAWCVRVWMVWQILSFGEALEKGGLFHSDWQTVQAAVDTAGRFKLIDLKAVKKGNVHDPVQTWYKGSTMLQVTAEQFIRPLLQPGPCTGHSAGAAGEAAARGRCQEAEVRWAQTLIKRLSCHDTSRRMCWTFAEAANNVSFRMAASNVLKCVGSHSNATRAALMRTMEIARSPNRSKLCSRSAYCRL